MGALVLRPFRLEDEDDALAAVDELARDDFMFLLDREGIDSWPEYLARLDEISRGVNLAEGRVRAVLLAAEMRGELVGRTSIRFTLNEWLMHLGGNIGYAVRPPFRRRGYASEILRQSLMIARAGGVRDALITCADTNLGSAAVIENAGGVLENKVENEDLGLTRRYWIRYPAV